MSNAIVRDGASGQGVLSIDDAYQKPQYDLDGMHTEAQAGYNSPRVTQCDPIDVVYI